MKLSNLIKIKERSKKRLGRGIGSGKGGHTSSRGQKGQTSRSGNQIRAGFEGGQNPLHKRLPRKKGLGLSIMGPSNLSKPRRRTKLQLSLSFFNQFEDNQTITEEIIRDLKKVKGNAYIKVIDSGELSKKIILENIKVTKGAKSKIENIGGKII